MGWIVAVLLVVLGVVLIAAGSTGSANDVFGALTGLQTTTSSTGSSSTTGKAKTKTQGGLGFTIGGFGITVSGDTTPAATSAQKFRQALAGVKTSGAAA